MAVMSVDKMRFLSFIFAVLLSITVPLIALTLGWAIMHQHTKILLKSVEMILRYQGFILIFEMAIDNGHHNEFLKA